MRAEETNQEGERRRGRGGSEEILRAKERDDRGLKKVESKLKPIHPQKNDNSVKVNHTATNCTRQNRRLMIRIMIRKKIKNTNTSVNKTCRSHLDRPA